MKKDYIKPALITVELETTSLLDAVSASFSVEEKKTGSWENDSKEDYFDDEEDELDDF